MKRLLLSICACLALSAGFVAAQTQYWPMPSGVGTAGQVLAFVDDNNVQGTSAPSITSITVGSGTAITKIAAYTATVTSFVLAANSCIEREYSVSGITTADKVFVSPAYATGPEAPPVTARAAAAGAIEVTFCNVHSVAVDPETGTLNVMAFRS